MAKINFNSAALYVNGKKLPGVLDVQIEYKASLNIHFDYDAQSYMWYLIFSYKNQTSKYQIPTEMLEASYHPSYVLDDALKSTKNWFNMLEKDVPIEINYDGPKGSAMWHIIKDWAQQFDTVSYNTQAITGSPPKETTRSLSKQLPGIHSIVACPAKCKDKNDVVWEQTLWHMIQHLNDHHRWSRESIADFLDELPDDIDITFKTKELQ